MLKKIYRRIVCKMNNEQLKRQIINTYDAHNKLLRQHVENHLESVKKIHNIFMRTFVPASVKEVFRTFHDDVVNRVAKTSKESRNIYDHFSDAMEDVKSQGMDIYMDYFASVIKLEISKLDKYFHYVVDEYKTRTKVRKFHYIDIVNKLYDNLETIFSKWGTIIFQSAKYLQFGQNEDLLNMLISGIQNIDDRGIYVTSDLEKRVQLMFFKNFKKTQGEIDNIESKLDLAKTKTQKINNIIEKIRYNLGMFDQLGIERKESTIPHFKYNMVWWDLIHLNDLFELVSGTDDDDDDDEVRHVFMQF